MNKMKIKNPRYRFQEFFNNNWEKIKFKKYIKLYRGSSPRPIQDYLTNDNGVNWIKIGDTKNSKNYIISSVEEQITKEGAEQSRFVEKGELILANSMSYGSTYELGLNGCIYDGWFVLREYEPSFNKTFLKYQLNSNLLQYQYERLSAGGIVKNISSDIVYATKLFHTSEKEQEKIAQCLKAVDDLILLEEEKLEKLKSHKNGLLQKLFTRDTNMHPQLRFPNYREKLKKTTIKDVCNYSSSSMSLNDINPKGKYAFYDANNMIGKINSFASEKPYITILKDGAGVGRIRLLEGYTNFVGTMGMITNKNNCTIDFLYYLLDTINFSKYIVGGAIPHIYFKDYSLQDVIIPVQKKEQQKIAECLSSIDDLISAQTEKIETLKQHKKGLLQGLFPSIEEVENE